ncbi:MAG: chemotaxis protein CheR [Deltaproteobacteria bacterium]|nr:chemotaxis protein CheR [Deltaproteobacteria bacterium]
MAFTYFFRDLQTLHLIRDHVIPDVRSRRYIKIWDAGCAMGPEPYSLAIVLRESMGSTFRNVKIYATDIDESGHFGEIITGGEYPYDQLKRIPKGIFERYFRENGKPDHFVIAEELRRCVEYQRHDLLSLEPIRENLALIVCKNVLLHFRKSERVNVLRMFHRALERGGYLALEQTQKLPWKVTELFEPVVANAQLFRKVEDR